MSDLGLLAAAAGLVVVAGACAAAVTALNQVSQARAEEMQRSGVRGACNVLAVARAVPVHVSLLLLIRLACELTATTLVALVTVGAWGAGWRAALVTAGCM